MKKCGICLLVCFLLFFPVTVFAEETSTEQILLEDMDFDEMESAIEELLPDSNLCFEKIVQDFITGSSPDPEEFITQIGKLIVDEWNNSKTQLTGILILAISAAIFSVLSQVFEKNEIANISFLVIYLLFCMLLLRSFYGLADTAFQVISGVCEYMRALLPAYFLSISLSGSVSTVAVFYPFILCVIDIVVMGTKTMVFPLIEVYLLLAMINSVEKEEFLSKLVELLEHAVQWMLKTFLAVVCGFQIIQSMITPMVDSYKNSALSKTVNAIPGIGNTAGAVTNLFVGAALLVKNGIGVSAMVVLLLICSGPLVRLGFFTFLYKLLAAMIQPVSDKRLTACVDFAAKACGLLFRAGMITVVLFMLSIGIVVVAVK